MIKSTKGFILKDVPMLESLGAKMDSKARFVIMPDVFDEVVK